MMTKKNFIALADAIREHQEVFKNRGRYDLVFATEELDTLAAFCRAQNSSFNRERWLDYIAGRCGPNGGVR